MDPQLDLARRFFGAFARNDIAAVRECLAPEVVWHVPGQSAISGDHLGADGVIAYFARLHDLTRGTWRAAPIDLLSSAAGVVVIARGSGTRPDGRAFEASYALHLVMHDGKITGARLYPEDQRAFEIFWR